MKLNEKYYCLMLRPKEARAPAVFVPLYWYKTFAEANLYLEKLQVRHPSYQYEILANFQGDGEMNSL